MAKITEKVDDDAKLLINSILNKQYSSAELLEILNSARTQQEVGKIVLLIIVVFSPWQNSNKRYLAYFRQFYLTISNLQILQTRLQNLKWSHIHRVLSLEDPVAIRWYLESASAEMWSVRTLDRNIATQYYERHFVQPSLPMSESEPNKFELLKSPVVAEFLGFKEDASFSEEELESAIIRHLQDFLMEKAREMRAFLGHFRNLSSALSHFHAFTHFKQ